MIGGALYLVNNIAVTLWGNFTNPTNGSSLIYPITDWKNSPTMTAILCAGLLFVAMPLVFLFHFGLSLLKRKFIPDCQSSDYEKITNDEKEPLCKNKDTIVV